MNEHAQIVGNPVENFSTRSINFNQQLKGHYCVLQCFNADTHGIKLYESLQKDNNGESWTYLPYGPFDTYSAFKQWAEKMAGDPGVMLYAILQAETLCPIGVAGYLRINPEQGVMEVGHLHYSSLLKKTIAATEAMYLMMYQAMEAFQYRRYEWKCNTLNQPSRSAAERLGFKFEGIFRQSNVFKGYNRDTAWYSIIDSEWPTLKRKFQRWLNPNNFDENGKQMVRLQEIV